MVEYFYGEVSERPPAKDGQKRSGRAFEQGGGMSERFKETVLKTVVAAMLP